MDLEQFDREERYKRFQQHREFIGKELEFEEFQTLYCWAVKRFGIEKMSSAKQVDFKNFFKTLAKSTLKDGEDFW